MKLSARIVALCLGCFVHRGAAVSVRGLQTQAGLEAFSSISNVTVGQSGGVHAEGSPVVVPSDLAVLLNRLNDTKEVRVDPSQMKKAAVSLNVVGDLLKQVVTANTKTKKSLWDAAAAVGKCTFPKLPKYDEAKGWQLSFLQAAQTSSSEQEDPHAEAIQRHRVCRKQQSSLTLTLRSCYAMKKATLIARNFACKVTAKLHPDDGACNPNEAEPYDSWSKRMSVTYELLAKKVKAQRKECALQNRKLARLSAGKYRVGSCKYKKRKLKIKKKKCRKLKTLAKAATCRLRNKALSRCKTYKTCFKEKVAAYNTTKSTADTLVVSQKAQFQLLSRANCLSGAMDSKTGTISEAKLDKCIDKPSYDTNHFNLTYPVLPRPSPCIVSQRLLDSSKHCGGSRRRKRRPTGLVIRRKRKGRRLR